MKWIITLACAIASFASTAQSYVLKGFVVDKESNEGVPNSHVVNKHTFVGTVTNGLGYFELPVALGDTVVMSNVGYQFKYVAIDSALVLQLHKTLNFKLDARNYLLDEVSIYAITSNNPKTMPKGEPLVPRNDRIHISEPVAPTLANPLDLLYYTFGKRPKQLAALKALQKEDAYRHKLEEGNNRSILEELTGIPKEEMEAFMFYCKYSDTEIRLLNDYQFLISLLDCYEEYGREKEQQQSAQ